MKVALVQCPVWGTREPPLAIVQLAGDLKSKGHEVTSYDLNNFLYRNRGENMRNLWAWEQSQFWYTKEEVQGFFREQKLVLAAFVERVLADAPRLVGFSVAASSYHASVELAKLLRARAPEVKILFGGTVFTDRRYLEWSFNDAPVDYIVTGEGDVTVPELASSLEKGEDIARCAGIHYREGGEIRHTGDRPLIKSLDELAFMDFTDLRVTDYDDIEHLSIMSSRGCVWKCVFCSSRYFWQGYRSMSAKRLFDEIMFHKERNKTIGHVDFFDLAFDGDMKKVAGFVDLMIERMTVDSSAGFQWNANAVITPKLTPELLKRMKIVGCQRLLFGIESGSRRVLGLMHKLYDPDVAVQVLKDATAAGIKVTCNFMFGFPGETEEDFQETLAFLDRIAGHVDRVYPSRTYCAIEEYSYFHQHPEEYGIKTPVTHHLYWETVDGSNTYPVRLDRCRRFEDRCEQLGIMVDCGVRTTVELDNWFSLGMYYEFKGDVEKELECHENYLKLDAHNAVILKKANETLKRSANADAWRARLRAIPGMREGEIQ